MTFKCPLLSYRDHTGKDAHLQLNPLPPQGAYICYGCPPMHFSALNEHRFRHAFDCITPVCICGLANEDNEHFFLHCPLYHGPRVDLFDQISDIPGIDLTYFDESSLCNLLLYGNPSCTEIHNSIIIESTITYINATGRFI